MMEIELGNLSSVVFRGRSRRVRKGRDPAGKSPGHMGKPTSLSRGGIWARVA